MIPGLRYPRTVPCRAVVACRPVVALLAMACGSRDAGDTAPPIDPLTATAAELYGLSVGARWTYLRSGDVLRWKEITACEEALVVDGDTGERRTVQAYVRENRGVLGVTSVHYLMADDTGVHRVRRDDVDSGNLVVFSTYDPPSPRLLNGPYDTGRSWEFPLRTSEYNAVDETYRGASDTSAIDEVLGVEDLVTVAGTFHTLGIERQWTAFNAHNVRSHYAAGVGEVTERTVWPTVPLPTVQIEELVAYTPGYGRCDGSAPPTAARCDDPLVSCDDPWGTGTPGCTDPRVDPTNCGSCGTTCASGVCAAGQCQTAQCELPCEGTTICCPSAWNWQTEGCTSLSRDRWNCGGCGEICDDWLICDRGVCACAPGTRDCGTGHCESVLGDADNCGECGHACGGDTPHCDKGVCVASCLSVDLEECGDQCVDLNWDNRHCGACDRHCGEGDGTVTCNYGACVTCGEAGLTECSGYCANLDWSDDNCGVCGRACADDRVCVFGTCIGGDGTCAEPCSDRDGDQICCDGACVDPRTSDHHCGGCGVAQCLGGCTEACRDAVCTPVDCGGGDD